VGVRKRVGRLDRVSNGDFHRERTAIDEIAQGTAIDVFDGDKRQAAGFAYQSRIVAGSADAWRQGSGAIGWMRDKG
jgi:hypothetical protein